MSVQAAIAAAATVADKVSTGELVTRPEVAAAVADVRQQLQAAMVEVEAYGSAGAPLRRRVQAVAARLLDLVEAAAPPRRTVTITLRTDRSLIDVARELHGDGSRAGELRELNTVRWPARVPAGTVLVVYAE